MKPTPEDLFQMWLEKAEDPAVLEDLKQMETQPERMQEAFTGELTFGTAGLRGIMEAGTNRMNIYTVARASQGLAEFINRTAEGRPGRVAIGYDCRHNNELFSRTAAGVLAANGIEVYVYPELMPTPCVSFAVRKLDCDAGIMVTASHNTAEYNGYKVYGPDGCQITPEAAAVIQECIAETDLFEDVKSLDFADGLEAGLIRFIPDEVYTAFIEEVKAQSLLREEDGVAKDIHIVFSPLNGTGLKPVLRALKESGYTNIAVVKEQEEPDGSFPTCLVPNPEDRAAFTIGIEYAERLGADLIMATDPDADRIGIAVRDKGGQFTLLTGNETGLLLLDFLCARRQETGRMPEQPVMVKSLVSTDIAEKIADSYGVRTINVLTGFKFIGEQIAKLEAEGRPESYIFGFEESYGYLSGTYVRDKDAVNAALLIADMFAFYMSRGVSILDRLEQLYSIHGYCLNKVYSYKFEGLDGSRRMAGIMETLRQGVTRIGEYEVTGLQDYLQGIDGLPPSNVLRFSLTDGASLIARPSGTEPKLKFYVTVFAENRDAALEKEKSIVSYMEGLTA
ncbi:MAG: phospho-sugar mutase [Firmicutes bacterium]|nr:phospho-sugar mutase [Bacillota bacterium]